VKIVCRSGFWSCSYEGGEYIEVSFDHRPVEVINVWPGGDKPAEPLTRTDVRTKFLAWIKQSGQECYDNTIRCLLK
jgi:hypothetical protein